LPKNHYFLLFFGKKVKKREKIEKKVKKGKFLKIDFAKSTQFDEISISKLPNAHKKPTKMTCENPVHQIFKRRFYPKSLKNPRKSAQ